MSHDVIVTFSLPESAFPSDQPINLICRKALDGKQNVFQFERRQWPHKNVDMVWHHNKIASQHAIPMKEAECINNNLCDCRLLKNAAAQTPV